MPTSPQVEAPDDLLPRDHWRVAVTGGREWKDRRFVWIGLNMFETRYGQIEHLAEGEARGVDTFARQWAEKAGVLVAKYPADWDRYGDAAGNLRNEEMLLDFKPDILLTFPGGTGTQNCVRHARKMGIPRCFFNEPATLLESVAKWG